MSLPMKTCRKCQKEFPKSPEFFHKNGTSSTGKMVLRSHCKECSKSKKKYPKAQKKACKKYYIKQKIRKAILKKIRDYERSQNQ